MFSIGDEGDSFYIVLDGEVGVLVPYQEHEADSDEEIED